MYGGRTGQQCVHSNHRIRQQTQANERATQVGDYLRARQTWFPAEVSSGAAFFPFPFFGEATDFPSASTY